MVNSYRYVFAASTSTIPVSGTTVDLGIGEIGVFDGKTFQATNGVTAKSILIAQLNAWDKIIAAKSSTDPMFKKVLDSQKAFAQRAVRWDLLVNVDMKIAYDHYFKG